MICKIEGICKMQLIFLHFANLRYPLFYRVKYLGKGMKEYRTWVDARNDKFTLRAYFAADKPYMMSASEGFGYRIYKKYG
jgi:hypothetical protein